LNLISRRTFLATSASAAGILALRPGSAWAQEKRLRVFWWGNQDRAQRTQKVFDLYQAAHPEVVLSGETAPFPDYSNRLATQLVGGNAPDVVQMDFRYLAEYASRNALLPLDDYLGKELDLGAIPADQVEANRVNGKLYGVSFGVNCAALHVNATAWEEAGVEPPGAGMSYEDLAERGVRFKEATPRDNFYATSDPSGVEVPFENFLRQRGKALYSAEGELAFEAQDAADWFALWKNMRDRGACAPADVQATDQQTVETSLVVQRRAATNFGLANAIGPTRSSVPDDVVLAPYPVIGANAEPGHYLRPATRVSISASTQNVGEAVRFLAFFTQDIEAAKILGAERGIPVDPKIQQAIAPVISEAEKLSVNYIAAIGDYIGTLPPQSPPGAGEITDLLMTVSQEVGFDARSPQDGADALMTGAADILART